MIHGALVRLGLAGMVLASAACGQGGKVTPDDGWRSLLPDGSLAAWRGYQSDTVPAAWSVADGVLTKTTGTGDLISRDEFGDFELAFDWKIGSRRQCRHLLPRHRGIRAHLLDARRSISSSTTPAIPTGRTG